MLAEELKEDKDWAESHQTGDPSSPVFRRLTRKEAEDASAKLTETTTKNCDDNPRQNKKVGETRYPDMVLKSTYKVVAGSAKDGDEKL